MKEFHGDLTILVPFKVQIFDDANDDLSQVIHAKCELNGVIHNHIIKSLKYELTKSVEKQVGLNAD